MDKEIFIQRLKENLILWDVEQMFHTRLSDEVHGELAVFGIGSVDRELTTSRDCEEVAEVIESNRERMDAVLYADCMAELGEIKDDMKWLASKTGRRVMEIERWLVGARQKAKVCFPQNEIVMGRDIMEEPENLVVGIVAKTRDEYNTIRKVIEGWEPPMTPIYKTYIIAEQG